jgi:hypothetical protein
LEELQLTVIDARWLGPPGGQRRPLWVRLRSDGERRAVREAARILRPPGKYFDNDLCRADQIARREWGAAVKRASATATTSASGGRQISAPPPASAPATVVSVTPSPTPATTAPPSTATPATQDKKDSTEPRTGLALAPLRQRALRSKRPKVDKNTQRRATQPAAETQRDKADSEASDFEPGAASSTSEIPAADNEPPAWWANLAGSAKMAAEMSEKLLDKLHKSERVIEG